MDVVLGVAVTGPIARLALIGTGADAAGVIDQSVVDLANNPVEQLAETVVGTNRLLAGENHRLVGTRVCWTDTPKADQLRQALEDSGVHNVALLTESQAVKSLMRAAGRPGAALLFDEATATLSLVDSAVTDEDAPPTLLAQGPLAGGDATAALDTLMARIGDQPETPNDVYLVGASADLDRIADELRETSTMRVQIAEDPTFALARGAALAAAPLAPDATAMAPAVALTGDETAMAPTAGLAPDATVIVPVDAAAADQQLAYSLADEGAELLPGEFDEFDEFDDFDDSEAETGPLKLDRRSLLVGNAVIAFAVIGFASLAVALVVGVRPTSSQEPVVGHQNAAPGKFMPLLPTQQQAPVPPPPPEAPNLGYQGGTIPAPAQVPGVGPVPVGPVTPGAPGVPGVPGFVPNPNPGVPIPVPIIVPFPGWRPYPPPYVPPWTPPTRPTTPTTTATTPTTPTTTPYTPPTTPTTTPYTPITPTTTVAPTTTPYTPITPTTTVAPTTVEPTTVAPTTKPPTTVVPTQAPTTVAPTQAPTVAPTHTQAPVIPTQPHTQAPVVPQQPHSHS